MINLPGAKFICTVKPGDEIVLFDGKLILCNPNHAPLVLTKKGLFPLEEVKQKKTVNKYGICQCGAIKDALGCPNGH